MYVKLLKDEIFMGNQKLLEANLFLYTNVRISIIRRKNSILMHKNTFLIKRNVYILFFLWK